MRRLGLLLSLALLARAGDDPKAPVLRIHDCGDLKTDDALWATTVCSVKAVAKGADVRFEGKNIIVKAPGDMQEKIAKELKAVRDSAGTVVTLEMHIVKVAGGLGVASVPKGRLEALLKEKNADATAGPALTCYNAQEATLSVLRQISYVRDVSLSVDGQGSVTADPEVATVDDGLVAKVRPLSSGQKIKVAVEVSVSEVTEPIAEVELPYPLPTPVKIQVPECKSRSVARLVECAPGAYTVVDLGEGQALLLLAVQAKLSDLEPPEQDVPGENVPREEAPEAK